MAILHETTTRILLVVTLLFPVAYFLGRSGAASFFPAYLVGVSVLVLVLTRHSTSLTAMTTRTTVAAFCLVLYLAATLLWREGTIDALLRQLANAVLITAFIICLPVLHRRYYWFVEALLILIVAAAVVSILYSILLFHTLDYRPLYEPRLYAIGGIYNPVASAVSYGVALVVAACLLLSRPNVGQRVLVCIAIVICITGLIYTGTRSVWLGGLGALFCAIFYTRLPLRQKMMACTGVVVCLVVITGVLYLLGLESHVLGRSTSFRPEIWQEIVHRVWVGPTLAGFGSGDFQELVIAGNVFEHPHSVYLATFYYGGLIGFLLLLFLVGSAVATQFRYRTHPYSLLATTLLAFGLVTLMLDGDRLLTKPDFIWLAFWLPIALTLIVEIDRQPPADTARGRPVPSLPR